MDIVERLREALVDHPVYGKTVNLSLDYDDINEAADEIKRLREAVVEIVYQIGQGNNMKAMEIAAPIAEKYLQQKESK